MRVFSFFLTPPTPPSFRPPQRFHFLFPRLTNPGRRRRDTVLRPRNPPPLTMPPHPPKLIAEYAKSGRSTCKACSEPIPTKSLRLGLVAPHPGLGLDVTKWHHLRCFTDAVSSTDFISGFATLQTGDQDALKNLVARCNDSNAEEVSKLDGIEEAREKILSKKHERDEDGTDFGSEKRDLKRNKVLADNGEDEVGVTFSPSDIKEKYKDALLVPRWKAYQTLIFLEQDDGLHSSDKIAAFDFDGCLAKTSVKRVGANAWSLMYPSIPEKLQSLYNDGYKLVIFTNESNIDRWKKKRQVAVDSKVGRLNNFIKLVKVPMQVFIACGYSDRTTEDPFRKPKPGMWRIMEKHFNSGISIDMDKSFYVGDAAGRFGDHSDADIKFAEAVGLKFHVPEDFFKA